MQLATRTSYQKTALGWWWLVVRPLLTAIGSTVVMHSFAGVEAEGTPYVLFVLVGLAIWNLFEQGLMAATRSLRLVKQLDGDVPLILFPVGSLAPRLLELALTVGLILVMGAYFVVADGESHLAFGVETLLIVPAVLLCLLLALGLALFTAVLVGNKQDLRYGMSYVLRAWFFLTPVIYPLSLVPERWRPLASFNPMTTIAELFRWGLLGSSAKGDVGHALVTIPILVLGLGAGIWFFSRAGMRPGGGDPGGEDDDEHDLRSLELAPDLGTLARPLLTPAREDGDGPAALRDVADERRHHGLLASSNPGAARAEPPTRVTAPTSSVGSRAEWVVPVQQPMILISQIQRSGGTLFCRLFDDHPECFVHPYELHWGRPLKYDWPALDLGAAPSALFEALDEEWIRKTVARGHYSKGSEQHPFLFDRALQQRIFESRLQGGPTSQRSAIDAYLTSLFNAWLDYQDLYRGPKRFVVGFAPRVNMLPDSRNRFWQDYPDGYLLSVVREPANWFASAQSHSTDPKRPEYTIIDHAIAFWCESSRGTLAAHAERPDRVIVVLFEDLIQQPEAVMRRVCERTGLTFRESLVHPTYNGRPVRSNSSFDSSLEIDRRTVDRGTLLPPEVRATIAEGAGDLYARVKGQFGL